MTLGGNGGERPFGKIDVVGFVARCRAPLDAREEPLDRDSRRGQTAKVEAGDVAPREGDRLAVDCHAQSLGVRLPDVSVKLIAHDHPGLIAINIELEARRRFRESDQLQVVEVTCQSLGRAWHLRRRRAYQPDRDQRAIRPFAVCQLLAVDRHLGLIGAEPQREPVPAGRASQALHGQGGTVRRLNREALLRPTERDAHG